MLLLPVYTTDKMRLFRIDRIEAEALPNMKSMTGKQERKARPRINLEKEGRKCASAESHMVGSYSASTCEDHTGSRAILWLAEILRGGCKLPCDFR